VPYFSHVLHHADIQDADLPLEEPFPVRQVNYCAAAGAKPISRLLRIVRNELVFTLYLLILLVCLLTFNAKVIAIALLPLLAFIALKTAKNRSLRDGVQSVINLFMFSAGMLRGMARAVRDPMQRPAVTVFNPKHIDTENENSLR
jgi:hypothetical protein